MNRRHASVSRARRLARQCLVQKLSLQPYKNKRSTSDRLTYVTCDTALLVLKKVMKKKIKSSSYSRYYVEPCKKQKVVCFVYHKKGCFVYNKKVVDKLFFVADFSMKLMRIYRPPLPSQFTLALNPEESETKMFGSKTVFFKTT